MPTQLDKVLSSKNLLLGFAGIITATAAWSIWGNEIFPPESDPTGNPEFWTPDELRRWLRARNLLPSDNSTQSELLERVQANMRPSSTS